MPCHALQANPVPEFPAPAIALMADIGILGGAPGYFRLLILMANTVKKMLYQHEDLLKE